MKSGKPVIKRKIANLPLFIIGFFIFLYELLYYLKTYSERPCYLIPISSKHFKMPYLSS